MGKSNGCQYSSVLLSVSRRHAQRARPSNKHINRTHEVFFLLFWELTENGSPVPVTNKKDNPTTQWCGVRGKKRESKCSEATSCPRTISTAQAHALRERTKHNTQRSLYSWSHTVHYAAH